jgi:hypothetical protein
MRYEVSEIEVLDTQTGLIWQREVTENLTHNQALEHAERVSQETGLPWRVPTVDELASLVDRDRMTPASGFPNMPETWFWSSSPYVGYSYLAWYVNFNSGYVNVINRYNYLAVRLVRGG